MVDRLEPVRLVIDNAKEAPPPSPLDDDDDGGRRGGRDDGDPPAPRLPEDCPVKPLGILGDVFYYLDAANQLRDLPAREHSRLGILGLFGAMNHRLEDDGYWPARKMIKVDGHEEWITTGFKPDLAAKALMAAAASCGVWNPAERVRGRGAWLGDDGELILHCGDVVWMAGAWLKPGLIGRHVYPAGAPILRPTSAPIRAGKDNPAEWLLTALNTWKWRRGTLDAHLLLGWIGAAFMGGALDWRPLAWITGGSATGKSTLHKLIGLVFDSGLIQVADATPAGIWQKLGYSTLPVNFDELEAEEDSRRANAIIKFARLAASGAFLLRGGADHTGSEFVARSCFMFSSILTPALLGQDRNRMAILELDELAAGSSAPDLSRGKFRGLGGDLLRRLVDGWDRFPRALDVYRAALLKRGHSARRADVLGTLLAASDVLLHDAATDSDTADTFAEELDAARVSESEDTLRDEERCLQHILSSVIMTAGGHRRSVAEWIEIAASDALDDDWRAANTQLGTHGLKVLRKAKDRAHWTLAIANYHVELARLFNSTHWGGRSGTMGVWVQAFRRLPSAARSEDNVRFAAAVGKATLIPLGLVVTEPDDLDARSPERASAALPFDYRR